MALPSVEGFPAADGIAVRRGRVPRVVLGLSCLVLALASLPYVAGYLAAPRGLLFQGALNNVGDIGQYFAALRQGASGHFLYVNQYSSERVAPALIYPIYTLAGLLLGPLHVPVAAMYAAVHLAAAVALLAALWQFCSAVCGKRPLFTFVVTIFGGGLYLPALLVSGLVCLPFAPVALTAPELSVFAALLISPHAALGLAAELWAVGGYIAWRTNRQPRHLVAVALGGIGLGLSYPFGLPVLLAIVAADTIVHDWRGAVRELLPSWSGGARPVRRRRDHAGAQAVRPHEQFANTGRSGRGNEAQARGLFLVIRSDLAVLLALLPALAMALYYAILFGRGSTWGASNMTRLTPPDPTVLAAAYGPLALLAIPAVRRALTTVAGRVVVTWAAVNALLLLAPLPQSERLLNGWTVPLSVLAAATLARAGSRWSRRGAVTLVLSNLALPVLYLIITTSGANRVYYEPRAEAAAVDWIAAHSNSTDVVMASAGSGNLIVSAASCRVVVGQNFETFNWAMAQRDVLDYYSPGASSDLRAAILRRQHVTLVLDGPYERALGGFLPSSGRTYHLDYRANGVSIFAVETS